MTPTLSKNEVERKFRETVDRNPAMLELVVSLGKFDLSTFVPPPPPGWPVQHRDFELHFVTFAAVLSLVADIGKKKSCEVSTVRRSLFKCSSKQSCSVSQHS